jgi:virginiamycin B lyase
MRAPALTLTLAPLLIPPAPAAVAAQTDTDPQLEEWVVPYEASRPRDPMVGPDGRVWFVGQRSDYVAFLDPDTGEFRRYELDDGTGPHNLVVDDEGTVYYAGNRATHIGALDPESGAIDKIMMPNPEVRDPHTLIFDSGETSGSLPSRRTTSAS